MTRRTPMLILAFGNPAREDDGLGPALVQAFEREPLDGVDSMWDYQPMVEHAAEFLRYDRVIVADASRIDAEPFLFRSLRGRAAETFSTHAIQPEAVVQLARDTLGWRGDAYLLGIRGYSFEAFVEGLTGGARRNLDQAVARLRACIPSGDFSSLISHAPTDRTDRGGEPCRTAST